jgi:hypothetical protein
MSVKEDENKKSAHRITQKETGVIRGRPGNNLWHS